MGNSRGECQIERCRLLMGWVHRIGFLNLVYPALTYKSRAAVILAENPFPQGVSYD